MQQKSGAQISQKAFIQSAVILLALMILAGILTLVIPAGEFQRLEVDGRETIIPDSFALTVRPDYPIWRWFTAPLEVLAGPDNLTIIVIIGALLLSGCASSRPATINGECRVFHDPGFAVRGQRLKDKQWIGRTQQTGIDVCRWKRPAS